VAARCGRGASGRCRVYVAATVGAGCKWQGQGANGRGQEAVAMAGGRGCTIQGGMARNTMSVSSLWADPGPEPRRE
jgi:hypothetical protein